MAPWRVRTSYVIGYTSLPLGDFLRQENFSDSCIGSFWVMADGLGDWFSVDQRQQLRQ
jgi:hypothetical protein